VFYYLLIIGIFNLGLGFALAVYLGYGPPSFSATFQAMDVFSDPSVASPALATPKIELEPALAEPSPSATDASLPDVPASSTITEPEPAEQQISHIALLDDSDAEEVFIQPDFEAYDNDAIGLLSVGHPDTWQTNAKYVETSIQNLNVAMMKSGVRAIELDSRLRSCRGHTDAATIQDCLAQLKEDCQTYLDELREASEQFQRRIGESDGLSKLGFANEISSLDQAAQIETTLNNLSNMDFSSDLEAANRQLSNELDHLRVARHAWRDAQEATFLEFARIENNIGKIEKQLQDDPTTGLPNRIGLELALDSLWQDGDQQLPSAAALLDIDGLGKLNRLHGALVGDTILYQIARHLRTNVDAASLVGRTAGGNFLVVMPGCDRVAVCKMAETLRQSIEQIGFKQGEETLRVTVSAGVTELRPEQTDRVSMLTRLAAALKKAKQAGHNRSFFHDGGEARQIDDSPSVATPLEITL